MPTRPVRKRFLLDSMFLGGTLFMMMTMVQTGAWARPSRPPGPPPSGSPSGTPPSGSPSGTPPSGTPSGIPSGYPSSSTSPSSTSTP